MSLGCITYPLSVKDEHVLGMYFSGRAHSIWRGRPKPYTQGGCERGARGAKDLGNLPRQPVNMYACTSDFKHNLGLWQWN